MTTEKYKEVKKILSWVKRKILAHPELYNQGSFCGTECCIAGWIDIKANGEDLHRRIDWGISDRAYKALGIRKYSSRGTITKKGLLTANLFSIEGVDARRFTKKAAEQGVSKIDTYLVNLKELVRA